MLEKFMICRASFQAHSRLVQHHSIRSGVIAGAFLFQLSYVPASLPLTRIGTPKP